MKQIFSGDKLTNNSINQYCRNLFVWYNLLSIPAALSHESIIFLSLPINIIITFSFLALKLSAKKVIVQTTLIYIPTTIVAFLCIIFRGDIVDAVVICQSWQEYVCNTVYHSRKGVISLTAQSPAPWMYIGTPVSYFIKEVWRNNILAKNGLVFFQWISTFLLCTLILMNTSSKIIGSYSENLKRKLQSQNHDVKYQELFLSNNNLNYAILNFQIKYFFIPFIFSFILYVIAQDWGRWFFMISTNYTICLLSPSLIMIEIMSNYHNERSGLYGGLQSNLISSLYSIYFRISNKFFAWFIWSRFRIIYFLTVIFTLFILKVPHHINKWDSSVIPWILPLLKKIIFLPLS